MATKKITLNELRSLVKQVVKEEEFGVHKDGRIFSKEETIEQLQHHIDDLIDAAKAMETMVSKGEKPTKFLLELSQNTLNSIKSLSINNNQQ